MAKTSKPAATTAAPASAVKPIGSSKKPENQLAQEAKNKQTPAKSAQKKKQEEVEESDGTDSDDREEMEALFAKKKSNGKGKTPEDEVVAEDDEDDEDEEDDEDGVYRVTDHLACGNQIGICIPAGSSLQVLGAATDFASFPLHLTNACLGPEATEGDRACLVVTVMPPAHDHGDEEDEEHDHDHDEDEVEEIICGTLVRNTAENIQLDLVLDGDFIFTNTSEKTDVFVTARLIPGEDDDDEDDEDYDENDYDDEDDEDEDTENSRMSLDEEEEEEEEEEDEEEVKARAAEMRKRLLGNGASTDSKKAKMTPTPKVLDVKPTESAKKAAPTPGKAAATAGKATATPGKAKPTAEAVKDFLLGELKTKKSIKNTDIGTMVVNKFGAPFKTMGFEEKTITKFLETHAKGKVTVTADTIKYTE
jgi:hypothetical protein